MIVQGKVPLASAISRLRSIVGAGRVCMERLAPFDARIRISIA